MKAGVQTSTGSQWSWPCDLYDPASPSNARKFQSILEFDEPKYSQGVKWAAYWANWLLQLRLGGSRHGRIVPVLPASELEALTSIPEGAGNLLVGPHPGPVDPQLIFHLLGRVHRGPAVFLMAAESYYSDGRLRRWVLNRLGVIPVARGRKNPQAIRCMTEHLAHGWWGGIFPEGEVYFSRDVMPMEYGAVRIAVEAALQIASDNDGSGRVDSARAMFMTPFALVYFFTDPAKTMHCALAALREIEAHPVISIEEVDGSIETRLQRAADKLLANKAATYGVRPELWQGADRFERVRRLQDAVLGELEERYIDGRKVKNTPRRRAMIIRMACFELLANGQVTLEERRRIESDVQKTRELILMTPFTRAYREKYGDIEMWIEYLRRFRSALKMSAFDFGPQEVVFKILPPIDMRPLASDYSARASGVERREFLYEITASLQNSVQAGVDEICQSRLAARIADAADWSVRDWEAGDQDAEDLGARE
ncbi:MAG: lysophospholipid acyltransferase family protein [Hyphomicrobiaceae bacterium]